MLERLQQFANQLRWSRIPLICLALLAILVAAYVAIFPGDSANDALFIPAILLFCWSALVYGFINMFHSTPPAVDSNMKFFRRQAVRFKRILSSIIALGVLVLTLSLFILSFKLITTGLG